MVLITYSQAAQSTRMLNIQNAASAICARDVISRKRRLLLWNQTLFSYDFNLMSMLKRIKRKEKLA